MKIFNKILNFLSHKPKADNNCTISYLDTEPDDLTELENPKYKSVKFTLTPLEAWRMEKFKEEHEEVCHTKGYRYSIMFSQESGIGISTYCVCGQCGRRCDVTDVGAW